ncbi:DUF1566 domain-containing protein [Candidatus Halocynthiibacter alkanivorans]|uniref:Lcl C-terminal domain-containing protein n=1 Tax=Candidatus Halocynthiibacter alkanivorans TaxID=2267619 RepID=UPI00109D7D61|nr:DUF1566 domain-containing protein [Candidatus Halocynthiibacter alkanivorans]
MKTSIISFAFSVMFLGNYAFAQCRDFDAQHQFQSRFKVAQGIVQDNKTHLTWQRCSVGTTWSSDNSCSGEIEYMSLSDAKQMAATLADGWRIPNIEELSSLLELSCTEPSINAEVFPGVKDMGEGAPYWSISEVAGIPTMFYFIDFWEVMVDGHSNQFPLALRLVRD